MKIQYLVSHMYPTYVKLLKLTKMGMPTFGVDALTWIERNLALRCLQGLTKSHGVIFEEIFGQNQSIP